MMSMYLLPSIFETVDKLFFFKKKEAHLKCYSKHQQCLKLINRIIDKTPTHALFHSTLY